MSGAHARSKGARGEREAIALLEAHGISARRTASMQAAGVGSTGIGDLVCDGALAGVHVEVKRRATHELGAAARQARADARGRQWLVLSREDRGAWVAVTMASCASDTARRLTRAHGKQAEAGVPCDALLDGLTVRVERADDYLARLAR